MGCLGIGGLGSCVLVGNMCMVVTTMRYLFGVRSLRAPLFLNEKHCVLACAFRVLANAWVALL